MKDTAILLVAHGDRGGQGNNRALQNHCRRIAAAQQFVCVVGGVLKGEPSLESAIAQLRASAARQVIVYPLFMAEGYFTKKKLPERMEAAQLDLPLLYARPMGVDPALPALTLARTQRTAKAAGLAVEKTRLLIVGHGSKVSRGSARSTEAFAEKIRARSDFAVVETAYLEEAPFLTDKLRVSDRPTVVEGFFSGDGMHAGDDVPEAIEATGANAVYAGSLGADPALTELILAALEKMAPISYSPVH